MNEKLLPCPWCQKIPSLWTPREVRGMNANCICFTLRVRPEIWNTRAVDGEKEKMKGTLERIAIVRQTIEEDYKYDQTDFQKGWDAGASYLVSFAERCLEAISNA
jgi:hypothetical protein